MAEKSVNFYQSERKNIVVSAEDFSYIDDIDDFCDDRITDINAFLESKEEWENAIVQKRKHFEASIQLSNIIFDAVYTKYSKHYDSVKLFDVITTYYDFDVIDYYNKLSHHYRKILLHDLKKRLAVYSKTTDTLEQSLPFSQLLKFFN